MSLIKAKIKKTLFAVAVIFGLWQCAFGYELSIGDMNQGAAGSVVQVPVILDTAANVASIHVKINYDPLLLSLQSVTNSAGTIGAQFYMAFTIDEGTVDIILVRDDGLTTGSGNLVYLNFAVNMGAVVGMSSELAIADRSLGAVHGKDMALSATVSHDSGKFWMVFDAVDSDGDGLSDCEEQMVNGAPDYDPGVTDTDVNNPDSDGDKIPDGWEVNNGLDPLSDDAADNADGDELSNYQEWIAGTSPTNQNEYFQISHIAVNTNTDYFVIYWNTVSGRWYSVYSKTNLLSPSWITNLYRSPGDGSQKSYTNTDNSPHKFFCLGVEKQP